jgi:Coenzyme PQQ synthesis protein D (PqqD)
LLPAVLHDVRLCGHRGLDVTGHGCSSCERCAASLRWERADSWIFSMPAISLSKVQLSQQGQPCQSQFTSSRCFQVGAVFSRLRRLLTTRARQRTVSRAAIKPRRPVLDWSTPCCAVAGIVAEPIGQELVILDLAHGSAYRLNATGRRVWEMLLAGKTATQIAADMGAAYGLDGERARGDVAAILTQLLNDSLIIPSREQK